MVTFGLVQVGFFVARFLRFELFRKQKCLGLLDSGCFFFFEGNNTKITYIYMYTYIYTEVYIYISRHISRYSLVNQHFSIFFDDGVSSRLFPKELTFSSSGTLSTACGGFNG